jgi:hypothetical protein
MCVHARGVGVRAGGDHVHGSQVAGLQERALLLGVGRDQALLAWAEAAREAESRRVGEGAALREHALCRRQRDALLAEFGSGGAPAAEAEALRARARALEAEREGLRRERTRCA